MNRYKKDIPLNILKVLQPYTDKTGDHFKVVDPEEAMLLFIDKDERSRFYFKVKSFSYPNGIPHLRIEFSPKSQDDVSKWEKNIKANDLDAQFKSWVRMVEEYTDIDLYDDPILKRYQDEFFQEFKLLDKDANTVSFDLETQYWLDEYCDTMINALGELSDDDNEDEVTSICGEINNLKDSQSALTKNEVIAKLSMIWAKSRKLGLNFLNEIFTKVKKSIVKKFRPLEIEE